MPTRSTARLTDSSLTVSTLTGFAAASRPLACAVSVLEQPDAATAMLIPYIFSFAFAAKQAFAGTGYAPGDSRRRDAVIASIATAYSLWLVYAAGATYVLMASILYAPGIIVHIIARRERKERLFSSLEALVALLIVGAAVTAIVVLRSGGLSLHG